MATHSEEHSVIYNIYLPILLNISSTGSTMSTKIKMLNVTITRAGKAETIRETRWCQGS